MTGSERQEIQRRIFTKDGVDHEMLAIYAKKFEAQTEDAELDKAMELWGAGWVSETPHKSQTHIMSWYWRRPAIGSRKHGRLFLSTDQALSALRKSR